MKNKILSIQSKLIYGYVGSNVAELAIQLHGLDVISFPTVLLSTHTGHQPVYGKPISKELFDELIKGIEAINVLPDVSCMVSGYMGIKEVLISAAGFLQKTKNNYPDTLYICDPVMGDNGNLYVPEETADLIINELIPYCDLLTPNHFELEYILKQPVLTLQKMEEELSKHPVLHKKTVIATSCHLEDTPKDKIETIIITNGKANRILTQKVEIETTGTGDLFSALLASGLSKGKSIETSVQYASETISKIMIYMVQNGLPEMNADCLTQYINR